MNYEYMDSPIMYMLIETDGKSIDELKAEVSVRVNSEFTREIERIRGNVSDEVFDSIHGMLIKRRDNIIKAFNLQLCNMDKLSISSRATDIDSEEFDLV